MPKKTAYTRLKEHYQELYDHMIGVEEENVQYMKELNYYAAFVEWKSLSDEFMYFRKNAHEIHHEDSPFPTFTL